LRTGFPRYSSSLWRYRHIPKVHSSLGHFFGCFSNGVRLSFLFWYLAFLPVPTNRFFLYLEMSPVVNRLNSPARSMALFKSRASVVTEERQRRYRLSQLVSLNLSITVDTCFHKPVTKELRYRLSRECYLQNHDTVLSILPAVIIQ
jgi:hypothetical protein